MPHFSFLSFQTHQRLLHSKSCVYVHVQVEATSNKCPSPQPDAASAGAQELMRAVGTTRASNPGLERARDWGGPFQTCNLPLPCRVGSPNASHFAGGQPQPSGGRRRQRGGRLALACRAWPGSLSARQAFLLDCQASWMIGTRQKFGTRLHLDLTCVECNPRPGHRKEERCEHGSEVVVEGRKASLNPQKRPVRTQHSMGPTSQSRISCGST